MTSDNPRTLSQTRGPRSSRKHTPKVKNAGLYKRAIRGAFEKLAPCVMLRNLAIEPNLFGSAQGDNPHLFNGLITLIFFFTLLFANFAEAVAEGRGKAQADSLRGTKSDTTARNYGSSLLSVPNL